MSPTEPATDNAHGTAGERARAAAVRATGLMDAGDCSDLDEFPALAAQACGMPIAALSLLDDARRVLIARVGTEVRETARIDTFCAQVVDARAPLEVVDARHSSLLHADPLLSGPAGIRSYAGVPLFDAENHCLGALFVADTVPRVLESSARAMLAGLARQAARTIALHADATRLKRLRRVQEASAAALGRAIDLDALGIAFGGMLVDLLEITGSAYGFIGEVRPGRDGRPFLKTHAITNIAWNDETRALYEREAASGMEFHRLDTLFGHVMTSGAAVVANDPSRDPRRGGLPAGHPPLNAFLGLPIVSRGKMVGMLGVANRPGGYAPGLVGEIEPLLAVMASLIDAARAERERLASAAELERQRAATSESERRFRAALESLDQIAVHAYGLDGRITFWNHASAAMYGYRADEALGVDIVALLTPAKGQAAERELMARTAASGDALAAGEGQVQRRDGSIATVYASRVVIRAADGKPEFFCFDVDLTARRAAEDALRASEQRLREITDSIPGVIYRYVLRPDGSDSLEYVSRGVEDIWEVDRASLLSDPAPLWQMIVPEDLRAMQESVSESARTLAPWRHRWRIRTRSGKLKWLDGGGVPVRSADGNIVWSSFILDRTQQEIAEQARSQFEARYRAMAENIPGAIFRHLLHPDGLQSMEYISPGAQAIWEYAPAAIEADAQLLSRAIAPEDRDAFRDSVLDSARRMALWQFRWRIVTPAGRHKWLQGSGRPALRENGDIAWDGYVFDVTERREAEAALALSEARLRVLVETSPHAIVVFDPASRLYVDHNGRACALLGVEPEALLRGGPIDFSPPLQPDGRTSVEAGTELYARAVAGEELTFEWLHQRADGTPVPCEIHLARIPDASRVLIRANMVDLTARKAAEVALERSEARLRLIVRNMDDGFYLLDPDWRIVEINDAAARAMPPTAAEFVGCDLRDVFPGVEQRQFGRYVASVLAGGPPVTMSDLHPTLGRWYEARLCAAGNGGVAVFFTDIHLRKQAELALAESERRFRSLVEDIGTIAVQGYDRERRVTFWNHASETLYGWSADEASGRPIDELLIPTTERPPFVETHLRMLQREEGETTSAEMVRTDRRGLPVPVYSSIVVQRRVDGEPEFYCVDLDLRALRNTEQALQQANAALRQRNTELQQFVMIASHDLQEPLRKVQTFADRLQDVLATRLTPHEADYLGRVLGAATRMRALIQDLLDYSKVSFHPPERRRVDLDEVLAEVLDDLEQAIIASGTTVHRGRLGTLDADPVQMQQLLQNLVGNAIKYRAPERAPEIVVDGGDPATANAATKRIRVADNGIGFDDAHRERIFAPFQRLHGRTEYSGTGIGLAIVQRIVDQHGGRIEAHGEPGVGATFTVELPRSG